MPSASWLRTNQSTADCAERRSSAALTDGQRSGGATAPNATTSSNARVSAARHTRAAGVTAGHGHRRLTAGTSDGRQQERREARTMPSAGAGSARRAPAGRSADRGAVPVHDLQRVTGRGGLDAKARQPVEPADHRAPSPLASRSVGSMRSTRSRVDGTAQMTSTAMPSTEKTSTAADTWIVTWKTTATHTAA